MSAEYDRYLIEHKNNVRKGYEWMRNYLPNLVNGLGDWNTNFAHDESKSQRDEYEAYDAYFYGGNRSYQVVQAYNRAWLLHLHRNPHHWQHWVLINDDPEEGEVLLDMPMEYIIEMICDWWSFSWKTGNLYEIFNWYEEHKDHIKLSVRTRNIVENILENIEWKLSETNSELVHHGIKGQRWGVRRFQNEDGTLTTAGKLRKKSNNFERAEQDVINNCSNSYKPLKKSESINISSIKDRSGLLSDTDAYKVANLAKNLFDKVSKVEPKITKDVVDAVSNSDCMMYGLEHRLKLPNSMAGKIGSDAKEKNIPFEDASKNIKDAIRYTAILDTDDFVSNYQSIKNNLEKIGYSETNVKNYFEKYKAGEVMHKAVQCTYKSPDGFEFEIQFQTPSSQAAKELKIPIYEERRRAGISFERASELEAQMRDLAESVVDPPGIERIK